MGIGWFNITNAEHPDFHPLFTAPEQEEETMGVEGMSRDKGKGRASRPPSTDIHSPWDPEPAVRDESEPSEEEKELSEESVSVMIPRQDCSYVFLFHLMFHHFLPMSPAIPAHDPSGRHVI